MKKHLLVLLMVTLVSVFSYGKPMGFPVSSPTSAESVVSPSALTFPITFETETVTFTNFDGGEATVIANPHSAGINTSAKVGQMIKKAGQIWGGSWFDFGATIDFSTNKTFTMKVYSPRVGVPVLFKVENATNGGINKEVIVNTTKANEWEVMSFDFSSIDMTKTYQKIVLIFDMGTVGDGSANFTFQFDDINLITPSSTSDASLKDLKVSGTTIAGFAASTTSYTVALPIGTTVVPPITAETNDPAATYVITPASAIPGTSTVVVTAKDGTTKRTYSVAFIIALNLPVTFESTGVNYGLTDFGNNSSSIVVDPTNAANKVAKTIKLANAETWAGTTVGGTTGFASPIPFTASSTKMTVRVWSPTAGTPIRLKVEDKNDPTKSCETEALTTKASAWEYLVFDFSVGTTPPTAALDLTYSYTKASIFFNFGTTGAIAGEQTYYWDDMYFGIFTDVKKLNASSVSVYPNPAENILYIKSNTTFSKIAIYNVMGTQVKEYRNVLQRVNVGDLKAGVYSIRLTDADGKTASAKFIKK
jgi:hypothetical protein